MYPILVTHYSLQIPDIVITRIYSYYTKDDVAKITDIGIIFKGSNIETFD